MNRKRSIKYKINAEFTKQNLGFLVSMKDNCGIEQYNVNQFVTKEMKKDFELMKAFQKDGYRGFYFYNNGDFRGWIFNTNTIKACEIILKILNKELKDVW